MALKPDTIRHYRVFLASPGDVENERQQVRQFFADYNRQTAHLWNVQFDVIDWENYSTIGVGRPQELITEQTLERYRDSLALVVGIMWQRFGTPTGKAESGTEAEFRWAMNSHQETGFPEIKWFFRVEQEVSFPTDPTAQKKAIAQWRKVCAFRKEMEGLGNPVFYGQYQDGRFLEVLRQDLNRWLSDEKRPWHLPRQPKKTAKRQASTPRSANRAAESVRVAEQHLQEHAERQAAYWNALRQYSADAPAPAGTTQPAAWIKDAEDFRLDCYVAPSIKVVGPLRRGKDAAELSQREEVPVPGAEDEPLLRLLQFSLGKTPATPCWSDAPHWLQPGRSLVITDRAGAGKTIATLNICRLLATDDFRQQHLGGRTPLVVRIAGAWPTLPDGRLLTLPETLRHELRKTLQLRPDDATVDPTVDYALKNNRCILVMDGFDQLSQAEQQHVETLILTPPQEFRGSCRWVVASRLHSVDDRPSLFSDKHWQRVSLCEFTQEQQDGYFQLPVGCAPGARWLQLIGLPEDPATDDARERTRRVRKDMQDLLGLPMVLWLLRQLLDPNTASGPPVVVPYQNLSELSLKVSRTLLKRAIEKTRIDSDSPQKGLFENLRLRAERDIGLNEEEQLEKLEHVLSLMAFQMAILGEMNGVINRGRYEWFLRTCRDRYFFELESRWAREKKYVEKKRLEQQLDSEHDAWEWAIGVLQTIELNHQTVIDYHTGLGIAFRSRKILECYAARYLTRYAKERDILGDDPDAVTLPEFYDQKKLPQHSIETAGKYASLCAFDFTTAPDWKEIWQLASNMPTEVQPAWEVQPAKPNVMLLALSALFRPPKRIPERDLRPTELMYRAWHRLEYLPELARHRLYWDTTAGRWLFGRELEEQGQLESRAQRLVVPGAAAVMAEFRKSADELRKEFAQLPQPVPEPGTSEHTAWLQQWATQSSRTKSGAMLQCPPQSWQAAYEAQRLADDPHGNSVIEGLIKPLPAFRLQATTVTRRQYRVFDAALETSNVGDVYDAGDDFGRYDNLYKPISEVLPRRSSGSEPGQSNDDFPVICVTWFDAWVFAKWLGPQFRLPKEDEWELACRAGTRTAYHFGDGLNGEQANCYGNDPDGVDRNGQPMKKGPYLGRTTPVGDPRYPCNAWGFWDVHGNVWEWCEEPYDEDTDPGVRVLRGGSWNRAANKCVASNRDGYTPVGRSGSSGFRLRVD